MSDKDLLVAQLPEPYNFYRFVLESDHLHFGTWPEDRPDLTLEEAQEVMFISLLGYFPDPPATVLVVGCGLGLSGYCLEEKGYHVTAIASSRELIDYVSRKYRGSDIDFHVADFLDDSDSAYLSKKYDVVLFQESLQYLKPLDDVLRKVRLLLNPEGVVIIGDEICYDNSIEKKTAVHQLKDIMTAVFGNGFIVTVNKEIGENVLRTCDEVLKLFAGRFDKIVLLVNKEDGANRLEHFLNGWQRKKGWYADKKMGYGIIVGAKDNVSMKAYSDGDEERILLMFNEIFNTDRTIEHWYWKFRDNPFGNLKIAEAVTEGGDLAAHYGGYPVPFYSSVDEPREFFSYQIGDTMTSLDFRGNFALGEASVLHRVTKFFYYKFCIDDVPFNFGYNTGKIRKIGERFLQYEYTSPVPYRVLDLKQKRLKQMSRIGELLSGFSVERVLGMSREYDLFFEKVRDDYGMLVRRTSPYLKWRYLDCPDNVHSFFAVRRFGKLVGWGVFSTIEDLLLWGDALFDKKYPAAVSFMLNYLVRHFFKGVASIEGWFSPVPGWWSEILHDAGFERRAEPNNLAPTFKIFEARFSTDFFESNSYYTMGDSDLF